MDHLLKCLTMPVHHALYTIHHAFQHTLANLIQKSSTDIQENAADTALTLSMMVSPHSEGKLEYMNQIMDVLTHVVGLEITQRRNKVSQKPIEIFMICEKLAAAGCCDCSKTATKTMTTATSSSLPSSLISLYFTKTLHAAIDALPGSQGYETLSQISEKDTMNNLLIEDLLALEMSPLSLFDDPSLPLVVNVGCGLGVTLIGLAHEAKNNRRRMNRNMINMNINSEQENQNFSDGKSEEDVDHDCGKDCKRNKMGLSSHEN
eukprot:8460878-Ditylum_brightwellii.AAC.1